MADNVAITAGTGTTIATDEVAVNGGSTGHVQFVKLVDGTADGATGIPGDSHGLYVSSHLDQSRIATTSSGLTIATTAYASGDQVGVEFTFANAARVSGGSGTIVGVTLLDKADVITGYDVVISRDTLTPAADNSAYTLSDADAEKIVGVVMLGSIVDLGANRLGAQSGLAIPYTCAGTALYATLRAGIGHTFFTATTDLILTLYVARD